MRITFPNPLGPPVAFDTAHLSSLTHLRDSLPITSKYSPGFRRTPLRIFLMLLIGMVLLTCRPSPPFPPSYHDEWAWERGLGEMMKSGEGRLVRFDVDHETDFNGQLQQVLLHHHLAILGNRSLAYQPFIQDETSLPFVLTAPPWRSASIPLSAFITTVISGFERFYDVSRAFPISYFDKVCRGTRVYNFKTEGGDVDLSDGHARMQQLQEVLSGDEQCVRIQGEVFDQHFFDSSSLVYLYETIVQSPVIQHFTFSPTILSILNRVLPDLAPDSPLYDPSRVIRATSKEPVKMGSKPWRHVLALHLPRADGWEEVCEEKGRTIAPFVGFNQLPKLPGNENIPPPPSTVEATRLGLYRAKCFPQILDIITRARRMKKNHPLLKVVYIITDEETPWADEVGMWLRTEGWDAVWMGKEDVYGDWEAREVGIGVDMEVARRAGVFVGNGFSSTSSNIILLRSRDGVHPDLTQFW